MRALALTLRSLIATGPALFAGVGIACAPARAPRPSASAPRTEPSPRSVTYTPPLAPAPTPAPEAGPLPAAALATEPVSPAITPPSPRWVFEDVRQLLSGSEPAIATTSDDELARWNRGGSSRPSATPSKAFQPAPRITVNTRVSGRSRSARGPRHGLGPEQISAQARSQGYWPYRRCFEAGLRAGPEFDGDTRLAASIGRSGRIGAVRLLGTTLLQRDVVRCLSNATRQLRFQPAPPRHLDIVIEIELRPGDTPLAALPPGADLASDGSAFDAARISALLASQASTLDDCYQQALAADPTLWGRLFLVVSVEGDGTVHRIRERESAFPDAGLVRCVEQAVAALVFPTVQRRAYDFSVGLRFGVPRTGAEQAAPFEPPDAGSDGAP